MCVRSIEWNELNPVVTYANILPCEPGYQFGPRIIYNHQWIYVAKGKGTGQIQDRRYEVQEGDLFYYGPHLMHWFQADRRQPFELYGMHVELTGELMKTSWLPVQVDEVPLDYVTPNREFGGWTIGDKESAHGLRLFEHLRVKDTEIPELLLQICRQYEEDTPMSAVVNRGLLLHFLFLLKLYGSSIAPIVDPHAKRLDDIRTKLRERAALPYERGWIAEWSGYNADYIARHYRERFGTSPHEDHLNMKLERAKGLLSRSDMSVKDVAEALAFSSVHYFCRLFKSHTGHTPAGYRRSRRML